MTYPESLPFVQMPHWLMLAPISPGAKVIYGLIVMHVNRVDPANRKAWPTRETLAELAGFSRPQSVDKYLGELEQIEAIRIERGRHPTQPLRKRNYYFAVLTTDPAPMGVIQDLSLTDFYRRTSYEDPRQAGDALERTSDESGAADDAEVRSSASGEVRSSASRDVRQSAQELHELDLYEVDEDEEDLRLARFGPDPLLEAAEDPILISTVVGQVDDRKCGYRDCRGGTYQLGSSTRGQRRPCPVHARTGAAA